VGRWFRKRGKPRIIPCATITGFSKKPKENKSPWNARAKNEDEISVYGNGQRKKVSGEKHWTGRV